MNFLRFYIHKDAHHKVGKALLWDFGDKDYDYTKNKKIIIRRVIEYGDIDDWAALFAQYGEREIITEIMQMDNLSDRNLNFVCKLFKLEKSDFKCSAKQVWRKAHWG